MSISGALESCFSSSLSLNFGCLADSPSNTTLGADHAVASTRAELNHTDSLPGSWSDPYREPLAEFDRFTRAGSLVSDANTLDLAFLNEGSTSKPKVSWKARDPNAKPWSHGVKAPVDDFKLPDYGPITDDGPTFFENTKTVLDAASVTSSIFLPTVSTSVWALKSLPTLASYIERSPSLLPAYRAFTNADAVKDVVSLSKWAMTTVVADGAVDFGMRLNDTINRGASELRDSVGEMTNLVCGINQSIPIKVGAFNFNGVFASAFLANTSNIGHADAEGNLERTDTLWLSLGVRPAKNNRFCGVLNGFDSLTTGLYFRSIGGSPSFSLGGTTISVTTDINPLSSNFGKSVSGIDNYLWNSEPPGANSSPYYQVGGYWKFKTDTRSAVANYASSTVDDVVDFGKSALGLNESALASEAPVTLPEVAVYGKQPSPPAIPDLAIATTLTAALASPAPDVAKTYVVKPGDTLWGISKNLLGAGSRYPALFHANAALLKDANKIYPGEVLTLPQ